MRVNLWLTETFQSPAQDLSQVTEAICELVSFLSQQCGCRKNPSKQDPPGKQAIGIRLAGICADWVVQNSSKFVVASFLFCILLCFWRNRKSHKHNSLHLVDLMRQSLYAKGFGRVCQMNVLSVTNGHGRSSFNLSFTTAHLYFDVLLGMLMMQPLSACLLHYSS